MPEIKDPVFFSFAKTSRKRSFSMIECERFGLVFANAGSINSGAVVSPSCPNLLWRPQVQHRSHIYCTVPYFRMLFRNHSSPVLAKIVVRKLHLLHPLCQLHGCNQSWAPTIKKLIIIMLIMYFTKMN